MLRFSGDQLSMIQAALAPPQPVLEPPPQLLPTPHPGPAPRPAPPESPPRTHTQLPLFYLLMSYMGLGCVGAWLYSDPTAVPYGVTLVGSAWLGLTVALHALAVPHSPAAQALGLLFALLHPAALALGSPEGILCAALGLSAFLTLSVPPRCGRRGFALLGLGLVGIGVGLSLLVGANSPAARSLLCLILTGLVVQAAVAASRLREGVLRVEVVDTPTPGPGAPQARPNYI